MLPDEAMPPDDNESYRAMLRVAEAVAAASVERFVADREAWSQAVLAAAHLPPWEAFVRIHADDSWTNDLPPGWSMRGEALYAPGEEISPVRVLIDRKHGRESKERYAYDTLFVLDQLRRAQVAQDMAAALRALHRLHTLAVIAALRLEWEPEILYGRKSRDDHRRGGLAPKQDPFVKEQRDAERQRLADAIWSQDSNMSKNAVAKLVGPHMDPPESPHTTRKKIKRPLQT